MNGIAGVRDGVVDCSLTIKRLHSNKENLDEENVLKLAEESLNHLTEACENHKRLEGHELDDKNFTQISRVHKHCNEIEQHKATLNEHIGELKTHLENKKTELLKKRNWVTRYVFNFFQDVSGKSEYGKINKALTHVETMEKKLKDINTNKMRNTAKIHRNALADKGESLSHEHKAALLEQLADFILSNEKNWKHTGAFRIPGSQVNRHNALVELYSQDPSKINMKETIKKFNIQKKGLFSLLKHMVRDFKEDMPSKEQYPIAYENVSALCTDVMKAAETTKMDLKNMNISFPDGVGRFFEQYTEET